MTPGIDIDNCSSENLTAWFQLMFEYNFAGTATNRICWQCGNRRLEVRTLEIEGGAVKYHLLCEKCGEFWVENHCKGCGTPLFKHELNYHAEVDGCHWHVICPKCGGRLYRRSR